MSLDCLGSTDGLFKVGGADAGPGREEEAAHPPYHPVLYAFFFITLDAAPRRPVSPDLSDL